MKKISSKLLIKLGATFILATGLMACGSDSNKQQYSDLRVAHASADAPKVQLTLNGSTWSDGAMLDYTEATPVIRAAVGTNSIAVEAVLPSGTATVIGPLDVNLAVNTEYDVFAIGSVAGETLEAFLLERPVAFDMSQVRVTVAHLTEAAPMVDVHVTAPDAALSAGTVLGSFSYKETLGPVEVAAGDYQIRVTPAGSLDVLYDSGTVPLAAGADLAIAAVPNVMSTGDTAQAKAPIALLVVDGESAATIYNATDGADLRVVHNSANAPAVDVVVNSNFEAPLVEDLAFPDFTGYVNVPADDYNVKVAVANTETVAIDADLTLGNAMIYSVIALNTLDNIEPLVLADMPRSVATEAKLRAIHGSTLAGVVDIYVTAEMGDINAADPAVVAFDFKADTGYISLAEGTYDITLTATGTKTVLLGPLTASLSAGGVYTVLARDEMDLMGANVTLMDDFVVQ